jgi:hypothetical protein
MIDAVQSRYAWASDAVLFGNPNDPYDPGMPVQRLIQLWRVSSKITREEAKEVLTGHAWTSFWVYRTIGLADGHKHMSWEEWCNQLRLGTEEESPYASLKDEAADINKRVLGIFSQLDFSTVGDLSGLDGLMSSPLPTKPMSRGEWLAKNFRA